MHKATHRIFSGAVMAVLGWAAGCSGTMVPADGGTTEDGGGVTVDAGGPDGGDCSDTWEDYGQLFFTTTCASCHDHDHSALTTRAGVLAQSALISQRVSSGQMPMGAQLSEADRVRVLDFISCGVPSEDPDAGHPYEAVSAAAAVRKVKDLLVGLPPTDSEIAAVSADAGALPGLIDGWMKLPQYQEKMKVFFELAFQQTQVTTANLVDLVPPQGLSGTALPMLVQNIRESFARTVLELDAEGRPFTDAFKTHRFMMTPALMELHAFLDSRHVDDTGKAIDEFVKAHPSAQLVIQLDAGAVPIEQSVDPTSPNFLRFFDPDLTKLTYPDSNCLQDPQVFKPASSMNIQNILYGVVDNHRTDAGVGCPQRGGSLAAMQLTPADFTTWKMVTIRQPVGTEPTTVFFDLPKLRTATELVLHTQRLGYFTTPGFQMNWPTNQSNQMRVTINQAVIVATNMQFDGLDNTPSPTTPGLDSAHASNSACYACHRLLDPTRAILASSFSWFYNQQTDAALIQQKGNFQFQGVVAPVNSLDDFGAVLASHPAVPGAWAQKLCTYANSAPCSSNDPEFQRVVSAFKGDSSWSGLVRNVFGSPLVTNLAPTATNKARGEVLAVARRDHLCAALDARLHLNDACGRTLVLGQKTGVGIVPAIVAGLPSDGYGRGATAPVLPNDPTLFYRAGLENICVAIANVLVDAAVQPSQPNALHWTSTQTDAALDDFTTILIGVPKTDARFAPLRALLAQHDTDAQRTGTKTDALRSTFVTACLSPTFLGVGL